MEQLPASQQPAADGNGREEKRKHGEGRIYSRPRSPHLWLQYYLGGRQIRISSGTSDWDKAAKILRRKIGQVAAGVHPDVARVTYEEMRDEFYLHYQNKRRRSLRRDKQGRPYLDKVKRLDDFFCGYTAKEIGSDMLAKFVADQQKRGRADGTINRSLSALRRMFNLALHAKKLSSVPYFGDAMLTEAKPRVGFFERDDYDRLRAALPAHLRLPLSLGYFTGMRLGEVLWLRWDRIHGNEIRLQASDCKNGKARTIPIIPELRDILNRHQVDGQEFVCTKLDRLGHTIRIQSFRKAWYTGCVKAGLGQFDETDKYVGRIFHDLRRSAVRNFVEAGIPEKVAMEITGHETRSVFDRYHIVSPKNLTEAGRKLAAYHEQLSSSGTSGDTGGDTEAVARSNSAAVN